MFLVVATAATNASLVEAQQLSEFEENRLLMEASTLETSGDLDGAESTLRRLLEADPTLSGALFGLERVLRAKGEVAELRPLVDAYLAGGPNTEVHGLKLELLVEADSVAAMVADAEQWIAREPREETFIEVARAYQLGLGTERALEVLGRGRAALGEGALALETGDLLLEAGDFEGAGREWALSVSENDAGMENVRARLGRMDAGQADAARGFVAVLGSSPLQERRRATLALALELGLEPEAHELAERHLEGVEGRARANFLNETGILAREAGIGSVAAWAYGELAASATTPDERRQLDERIVDVAVESGDAVAALAAQRRVLAAYPERSAEWRSALATTIRLEALAEPERVGTSWASFRTDFPDAPELDAGAAAVGASMLARGDAMGAAAVLDGVVGPRSSLERAYLLLAAGEVDRAREGLLGAVGGLPPSEATPIIQFVGLLGRLTEAGARALATASAAERRGSAEEAAVQLADEGSAAAEADRAPLLAEAARMAERAGAAQAAARIRRRLVEEHPDAPEVADATLSLARYTAGPGGNPGEAIRLLEELITSRPNAPVVPEARLELERIRNRGASDGGRS
ncbi:MAG: hypothetical protein WEB90_07510 [Gemmatimonadota bacterium]